MDKPHNPVTGPALEPPPPPYSSVVPGSQYQGYTQVPAPPTTSTQAPCPTSAPIPQDTTPYYDPTNQTTPGDGKSAPQPGFNIPAYAPTTYVPMADVPPMNLQQHQQTPTQTVIISTQPVYGNRARTRCRYVKIGVTVLIILAIASASLRMFNRTRYNNRQVEINRELDKWGSAYLRNLEFNGTAFIDRAFESASNHNLDDEWLQKERYDRNRRMVHENFGDRDHDRLRLNEVIQTDEFHRRKRDVGINKKFIV